MIGVMYMKTVGVQLFTTRSCQQTVSELDETIGKLKAIGYNFGQISGFPKDITAEQIKEISEKHDFALPSSHTNFDLYYENLDEKIKEFKLYGDKMPGIGNMPPEYRTSVEGVKEFMKKANYIADRVADEGMTFTYHNHSFEWARLPDGATVWDYITDLRCDNFKLMVDVFWLAVAGQNYDKFIREHKDMIGGVHFKDLKIDGDNFKQPLICEVLEGVLDWKDIFAACDEINPEYIFVEQDTNWIDSDPVKALGISYNNLKKYGYR